MQAIVVHETGGPEVLRLEEVPAPVPAEGEVLVRVHAASVNPIDWKFRSGLIGKPLPAILGVDFSGVVQESRAEGFATGDEVLGIAGGCYAQLVDASAGAIAVRPPELTHAQAAALPVAGGTAWQALFDRGGLEQGQTVVIAGASGGVGHLAVQLASNAGASVIGIGSARNHDFVLSLGAEGYVDYASEDVTERVSGADLAFDAVGGDTTLALLRTLRPGGTLVTIAGAVPEQQARDCGVRAELLVSTPDPAVLAALAAEAAAGRLEVEIAEVLPLSDAARAHELSESGRTRGKLVLELPS